MPVAGVPGVGWLGGYLEGYTGYYPDCSQDPYLVIFQALEPTHGQMKGILVYLMRFPRKGPRMVPESTQNDPRIDPQDDPPDWSPDGLQIPISLTSDIL